jgi:hypothetical protein
MSDRPRISERLAASRVEGASRRIVVVVLAIVLFGWVFLYRFNTLGGALGGFDNDHFLYYALAKQVQAGEQPLRDFEDAMHGAWPSLTYELSVAAQRLFGNNLRSEALLTVGGVALGTALAFVAASAIAPWPWAFTAALFAALLTPKLYGYPKVLVTAVASLLIITASGFPTWRRVAAMSVWTAIAFLFRHDLAVYCAVGCVALIALAGAAPWRRRVERIGGYVLITALLLAPSLWWVQRYEGVTQYVRNGLAMSRHEYQRTLIRWPRIVVDGVSSPLALFDRDENAEAWIYYVFLALPLAVIAMNARQLRPTGGRVWSAAEATARPRRSASREGRLSRPAGDSTAPLIALSLMTIVLWYWFLRGNLAGRFGELGPPIAVLWAWLLAQAATPRRPWPLTALTVAAAASVFAVTFVGTWRLSSVTSELRTARLLEPLDVIARTQRASQDLAAMPRSLREAEAADRMQASDYLHRCTRPADRVIAIGYYPDVPAFSERLFAGGRVTYVAGYYPDERYLRRTIARLDSQSVPIVLAGTEFDDAPLRPLADYVRAHYDEIGVVTIIEGSLRVWTRRGRSGTPSGPNGLPCFG